MTPLTLAFFIYTGNKLNFSDMMEVILLLNEIRDPLLQLNGLYDNIYGIRTDLRMVHIFLEQPEIKNSDASPSKPDYAVYIENQNYTWGIKTFDYDGLYDEIFYELKGLTQAD